MCIKIRKRRVSASLPQNRSTSLLQGTLVLRGHKEDNLEPSSTKALKLLSHVAAYVAETTRGNPELQNLSVWDIYFRSGNSTGKSRQGHTLMAKRQNTQKGNLHERNHSKDNSVWDGALNKWDESEEFRRDFPHEAKQHNKIKDAFHTRGKYFKRELRVKKVKRQDDNIGVRVTVEFILQIPASTDIRDDQLSAKLSQSLKKNVEKFQTVEGYAIDISTIRVLTGKNNSLG